MEAILTRRSIRKYTGAPVPESLVQELLHAAMSAPSARNEQPWHFLVVTDHKILDEIPKFHPYSKMLLEAPVAIVVAGDTAPLSDAYWIQDCSAATENILIAARARGLGAVWLGVYPGETRYKEVQKLLGMPEKVIPLGIIAIGYPAEEKPPGNRFNAERVHQNKW
ncbi:MAG: nitroreductase family protein [Chloroflexota bacterium]